jgi:UDP-N-acetylmuramoyl-L-alanyl-D-glutamate--2,6-diaminopimelate ligase
MPTATLLEALGEATVLGTPPSAVAGVAHDSRRVAPGECFVALPGLRADGRRFAADALARGAALVVAEPPDPLPGAERARVLVPSARAALARLAAAYHGQPARALTVVGITGTSGKTTTCLLVDAVLRAAGAPTGVVGTIEYRIGDEVIPAGQTTPEAPELQALLARMRERGVRAVAMEVSSHALAMHRVDGIDFDVAVFTNLSQDHLDFHGTMEEYGRAKARLFRLLAASTKPAPTAVVNADDPAGARMVAGLGLRTLRFGLAAEADVRPRQWRSGLDGIRMTVDTPAGPLEIRSALVGEHNVANLLAAVAVGVARRRPPAEIAAALGGLGLVPGRFERVEAGQPFLVVVDYAHKPDALERVLQTARRLVPAGGRLGVVFGCGGDRDRGKRPLMGGIAARLADRVWVTSDNPRSEPPEAIIGEIDAGIAALGPAALERRATQPDRRAAIRDALGWARAGDVVVIAGKGHETYQIVGADVLPFDDRAVARGILAELGGQARWA